MAEEYINKYSHKHKAQSVGTIVNLNNEQDGQTIKEFSKTFPNARYVIAAMKEERIDVSKNKRKQLTKRMLDQFDKIIVITKKEDCPEYLLENKKVEFWAVDNPKGKSYEIHVNVRDKIKLLITNLIKEIDN